MQNNAEGHEYCVICHPVAHAPAVPARAQAQQYTRPLEAPQVHAPVSYATASGVQQAAIPVVRPGIEIQVPGWIKVIPGLFVEAGGKLLSIPEIIFEAVTKLGGFINMTVVFLAIFAGFLASFTLIVVYFGAIFFRPLTGTDLYLLAEGIMGLIVVMGMIAALRK